MSSGRGKKDIKPDHPSQYDLYRTAGVIAKNDKGQVVIVKLTTHGKYSLTDYRDGKSQYKPFVEIEDNEGNPIVVGEKFSLNSKKRDLSNENVKQITNHCLNNPQTPKGQRARNQILIKKFNKRK